MITIRHRRTGEVLHVVPDGNSTRELNLRGADLGRAQLAGADRRGADLRRAYLPGANLAGADLRGADLREAHVLDASFYGALYDSATRWPRHFPPAEAMGANAVIGMRYDATEITPGVTEVLCDGTAVVVEPIRS